MHPLQRLFHQLGRLWARAFWDADGILMTDYLQKGQTINRTYYASLLRQLRKNIKFNCCGKLIKGVLFHLDSAPASMSVLAMAAINDCGFELIQHPITRLISLHQISIYSQS